MTAGSPEQVRALMDLCRQQLSRDAGCMPVLGAAANDGLLVLSLCRLSQTCSLLGDVRMARHFYELLLPYRDRIITVAGTSERTCAAAYFLGLVAAHLEDWDAAIDHLDHALRLNCRLAATYDAAQTRYAYASVLVVRSAPGDWEHARGLLSETVNELSAAEPENGSPTGRQGAVSPEPAVIGTPYMFRPDGDYWTLAYDSTPFHVRDVRGLQYIARLLRQPNLELHVLDLVPAAGLEPVTRPEHAEIAAEGLSVARLDDVMPALDSNARRAYVGRLRDLRADQDEAARNNDVGRSAALQREIAFLADQLLAASRPTRCTSTASPVERARINVRNAITGALKVITPHHNELARHLRNAIRTGTTCCYTPDRRVDWTL